jgi:hypothetical protein
VDARCDNKVHVPFEYSSNLSALQRRPAQKAMEEWQARTRDVIHFEPATQAQKDSGNYIFFEAAAGCGGPFDPCGMCAPQRKAVINVLGCTEMTVPDESTPDPSDTLNVPTGYTLHEFGHVLGLDHMQLRSDRDRYLELAPKSCFDCAGNHIGGSDTWTKFPTTDPRGNIGLWDFNSLMLYSGFSANPPWFSPLLTGASNCGVPTHCNTNADGYPIYPTTAGVPNRSYVGKNWAGGSPCANDISPNSSVTRITPHDASWVVELYRTANRWQPFKSLGYDRSAGSPLEAGLVYLASGAPNSAFVIGSPAVAWAGDALAFVQGNDLKIYGRWRNASRYDLLPGTGITSNPSAVSWSNSTARIDVVAFTGNPPTAVSKIAYYNSAWEAGWSSLGIPAGVTLHNTPGPAITSSASSRLEVFVRGDNGNLYWTRWNGSAWSAWSSPVSAPPGGIQANTRPAVAAINGVIFVIARGANADGTGALYQRKFKTATSTWDASWALVGTAGAAGIGSPALSLAPAGGSSVRADLYVRDASNGWLHQMSATQPSATSFSWSGASFFPLGGSLKTDPAVVAAPSTSTQLHIFALQQDQVLWHKQWPCTNGCDVRPFCGEGQYCDPTP